MGKRKRATKPPPKKKSAKLEKIFDCPFCGHEQTVDCKIERDINVGKVECRVCGVKFTSVINRLEEEIDVYSKWIDACEDANRDPAVKPADEVQVHHDTDAVDIGVADVEDDDDE